jgi:hypothetical protein
MALAVSHQDRTLAARERALVLQTYMNARRAELRHYVDLAVSTVQPLCGGAADAATRRQAIQRLAALDYGSDGYFFVYDLDGEVLMHSRQPELLGRNLWNCATRRAAHHPAPDRPGPRRWRLCRVPVAKALERQDGAQAGLCGGAAAMAPDAGHRPVPGRHGRHPEPA